MSQWMCFKCKEPMAQEDVTGMYLEIMRFIPGLICPKCGIPYIDEATAMEVIVPGEQQIDAKMA